MSGLTVQITGLPEVRALVAAAPEQIYAAARGAFSEAVFTVQGAVLQRLQGNPLQSRTGNLARSIIPEVTGGSLKDLKGRVYSTASYARIQEVGGTITAKNKYRWLKGGPYLNIPTENNKTAAGVTRLSSRDVFAQGGKVKNGSEGFGLYLHGLRMYRFAKRVTIKPQLGMLQAADDEVPNLLSRLSALLTDNLNSPAASTQGGV